MSKTIERHILQKLYDSEINFTISTFWDGGFEWQLGDSVNGFEEEGWAETFDNAVELLRLSAIRCCPDSTFAKENK